MADWFSLTHQRVPTYRVYKLNPAGRIVSGDWVEAADDEAARVAAQAMCDAATPKVELWLNAQLIAVLPCDRDEAAA